MYSDLHTVETEFVSGLLFIARSVSASGLIFSFLLENLLVVLS
jgi:hypothetical protein